MAVSVAGGVRAGHGHPAGTDAGEERGFERDAAGEGGSVRMLRAPHEVRRVPAMNDTVMAPGFFGVDDRRLFCVRHLPREGCVDAVVLMCPPLLHEHMRSYRFFSQVAGIIADRGMACLRFDYYGTGDSEGDESAFDPESASRDLALAAAAARSVAPGAPLYLMATRASALFAWRQAASLGAAALWLWQPVVDGARYVETLRKRDASERNSRLRYPRARGAAPATPDDLMGYRLPAGFPAQMQALRLDGDPGVPVALFDTAAGGDGQVHADARFVLPEGLQRWTTEIDLDGLIPLGGLQEVFEQVARWQPERRTDG